MLSKLRRFSLGEWWVAAESAVLMPLLALALKLTSFKRVQAVLRYTTPMLVPELSPARAVQAKIITLNRARRVAGIVNGVAHRGPYRANCLKRSLTLWWLLRQRGIESDLRIGVRKGASGFEAHAWIEIDGMVINDRPAFVRQFIPFVGNIISAYNFT